jgi:hypothetical protein
MPRLDLDPEDPASRAAHRLVGGRLLGEFDAGRGTVDGAA